MFAFELFWPFTLVSAPGFVAYAVSVLAMMAYFAVPALMDRSRKSSDPKGFVVSLVLLLILALGPGPYLLRQALTVIPFAQGAVSTQKRQFLVTGGKRERSGEAVIRLSPTASEPLRDVSLVVEPQIMAPFAAKAKAFRLGETPRRDCLIVTTQKGAGGFERIYSGAVMREPLDPTVTSIRC